MTLGFGQEEFDFKYGEDFAESRRGLQADLLQGGGSVLQPGKAIRP
jgi:hypothetical protein